jgi:FkbM family methyltransferase
MISYSMNGEDVLLQRVFAGQASGFYVDVGANSPHRFSNTKHFYENGWHGINIEPTRVFAEVERARPRDINLRLAVSDHDGFVEFHELVDSSLSSVEQRELPEHLAPGFKTRVAARTLASILDQHAPAVIDFMSVDVEGHEAQVLRGNDWNKHRPRVLVIESTAVLSHRLVHEAWEEILLGADYRFAFFDGINRFYVRREDAGLLQHFAYPPTCLEYQRVELFDALQTVADLERQLRRERAINLWYDLTTLVNFPGNTTGIPRVVTKVLDELLGRDDVNLRLCMFDAASRRFVEITDRRTLAQRVLSRCMKLLDPLLQRARRWCTAIGSRARNLVRRRPVVRRAISIALWPAKVVKYALGFLRELAAGILRPHRPGFSSRPPAP